VSLQVDQAHTNLKNALSRLEVAKTQVGLARETYRLAKLRADNGEGIQLEVTDAQTELTRSEINLVTARYDYLIAYAELLRAVGEPSDSLILSPERT
jgi:outer membrane protein TolC